MIVTSDHGFGENRTGHICDNDRAVLILNNTSLNLFRNYQKTLNPLSYLLEINFNAFVFHLKNFHIFDFLRYIVPKTNYIIQIDVFDKILEIFGIDYEKIKERIPKIKGI